MAVTVRPVTRSTWKDFANLFTGRGCPSHCWCTLYRFRHSHEMSKRQKRDAMRRRVSSGSPIGILAYDGDEPVGWCSIAPRETYEKLDNSRTMPRMDDAPTWTVLCFFVRRDHRGQGATKALLRAGVKHARAKGAAVIEGYPFDTMGITSRHRGHSSVFRSAGFRRKGKRWVFGASPKKPSKDRRGFSPRGSGSGPCGRPRST